jgi:hypothetical protein
MDLTDKHRSFLFLDDFGDGTPSVQCRQAREREAVGLALSRGGLDLDVIWFGGETDVGESWNATSQEPGIRQIGRFEQLTMGWDGAPGTYHRFDALVFPSFNSRTVVSWDNQNFESFATSWEAFNSPLLAYNHPGFTPVVDECGMVVGYYGRGIDLDYLFATDAGEIFYASSDEQRLFGWRGESTPRSIAGNDIYLTSAGGVVAWSEAASQMDGWDYSQMYHEKIPEGNKANVLVDIDGYVVAIDLYLDPPPMPDMGQTVLDLLVGFVVPTLPSAECMAGGEEEESYECRVERTLFQIDLMFLFIDIFTLGSSAVARRMVTSLLKIGVRSARAIKAMKGAQVALKSAHAADKAVSLTLDLPKIARPPSVKPIVAAGKRKPKLMLAAEKSSKKKSNLRDLSHKSGMTNMAIRDVRHKIMKHQIRIRFRPAGDARKLRKGGAIPKWEELKMKTINDDDIALGAPKAGKSQPGFLDPKNLKLPDESHPRYKELKARYDQRAQEFNELGPKVKEYEQAGDIKVENGIVKDGATGKTIAGDYDIYEILDSKGVRITKDNPRYKTILKDLGVQNTGLPETSTKVTGRRIQAQHGAHVEWDPTDAFEKQIKQDIINKHKSDVPLYEFREDGSVWEVFAD